MRVWRRSGGLALGALSLAFVCACSSAFPRGADDAPARDAGDVRDVGRDADETSDVGVDVPHDSGARDSGAPDVLDAPDALDVSDAANASDTTSESDASEVEDGGGVGDSGIEDASDSGVDAALEPDTAPDVSEPDVSEPDVSEPDTAPDVPEPVLVSCDAGATPNGEREVNTYQGDVARVEFRVEVPAGELQSAVLRYYGYDVDHPGEEGWIAVNDTPLIALPADPALDNGGRNFEIDVSGRLREGTNTIAFVAFDRPDGSFFRISQVGLGLVGYDLACEEPQDPVGPTGEGVERIQHYRQAEFRQRHNWVLDCRDYAYTASGDEHRECDGTYNPDGERRGRAIFTFNNVIADRYEVWVEGRNTENRNPEGALFIVEGVERRIPQRDDRGFVYQLHGTYDLSGTVTVILNSLRENQSDSVRHVRLTPVQ